MTGRAMLVLAFTLLAGDARWTLAAVLAGAVHELGHLIILWLCGRRIMRLEVDAWGAVIETEPLEAGEELLCALAGPAAGLMLFLFWRMIPRIGVCALMQSVFNLIPVYPLDGGRAIRALRNICCKDGAFGVQ